MLKKLALAGAMVAGITLVALAQTPLHTYRNSVGTEQETIGVQCINNTTGEPESCGAGGGGGGGDATAANQVTTNTEIGGLTETAPATDTASSGLNGRLQRIAQRLTALLPTSLGAGGGLKVDGSGTALPVSGTVAGTQSGTWTVQPGNTANTTPWLVTLQPTTSGGSSTYSGNVTTAGAGAGTGGVAVDASAGQLYGYAVYNGNATVCYLGFYDQTQALTNLGTTVPKLAIGIPANGGANISFANGIPFATAITISATTTRAGSTACSTGLDINVMYK